MTTGDLSRWRAPEGARTRQSAVLVLFGDGSTGPDLLLTERAHDMRSHPGQVSFPGGGMDPGETPVDAALREAREETGLVSSGVEVFGTLPQLWLPPSNNHVTPVLGYWRDDSPVGVVDPREVHAVYRVPIAHLTDPANRFTVRHVNGTTGPGFWIGEHNDVLLWGFTGILIAGLIRYVGWEREWDAEHIVPLPERMIWSRGAEDDRP